MIDINVLPGEKETIKVLRRNGLNFRAEPIDREAMNSRQQPAITPFLFVCRPVGAWAKPAAWMKFSAQHETFRFKGEQSGFDLSGHQQQFARKIDNRERARNFQSTAD
jgi:hypothetical protein